MESQVHSSNPNLSDEICVWVKLTPGIDPGEFAVLCQNIAGLSPEVFSHLRKRLEQRVF